VKIEIEKKKQKVKELLLKLDENELRRKENLKNET